MNQAKSMDEYPSMSDFELVVKILLLICVICISVNACIHIYRVCLAPTPPPPPRIPRTPRAVAVTVSPPHLPVSRAEYV